MPAQRLMFTGRHTVATANAIAGSVHYFRMAALAFRVMAPLAGKGAALQKDRGPNAWTIMQREAHDIEYKSLRSWRPGEFGLAAQPFIPPESILDLAREAYAYKVSKSRISGAPFVLARCGRRIVFLDVQLLLFSPTLDEVAEKFAGVHNVAPQGLASPIRLARFIGFQ